MEELASHGIPILKIIVASPPSRQTSAPNVPVPVLQTLEAL